MKNKDYLTVRQEELMNFLWKVNEPLTANEMAERLAEDGDRKSTRLNSSHLKLSRMPSSA